jgi:hypothetical protein
MADNAFINRNTLFQVSKTYVTEELKRRLKRCKGKPKQFNGDDFYFDKHTETCCYPVGKDMWLQSNPINVA